ncbi:MAG TPA: cob(I)yrinic acid a,c-diamide adenosyltransferase [Burkholderiaceae bacterium]|jgi:cob(I)alamin adenosyltransferase|nr:cob(I)yrinic acid a,c-diamide adenosyltransferase [Burkholderiaceae bacterium]
MVPLEAASGKPVYNRAMVYLSKIYTKTGDKGATALVGGQMVPKDSARIESYGTVDELNSVLGLVLRANEEEAGPDASRKRLRDLLTRVQNELFNLGSLLATLPEDVSDKMPRIESRHVEALEHEIDALNEHLPPLRSFTLPGGGWVSSYLHLARTVCRRAERRMVSLAAHEHVDAEAVKYLNRLSDTLYVLGRWNVRERGEQEPLWTPETT